MPPNAKELDVGVQSDEMATCSAGCGIRLPYASTVELISGEIGDDVTHYLVSSEQTPSALVLGVFVGAEGLRHLGATDTSIAQGCTRRNTNSNFRISGGSAVGYTFTGWTDTGNFEQLLGDMELVILQKPSWCVFTVVARLTEWVL